MYNISTTSMNASITGSAGSVANSFTVGSDFTGTGFNGSAAVSDWALKMTQTHTWTSLQNTSAAGTTTIANGFYAGFISAPVFYATSSTATSSAANGWNLTGGCFSVNGACIGATGAQGATGPQGADDFTHTFTWLSATTSVMEIGTTTAPTAQLTVGSSTRSQLALSDNISTDFPWVFRSAGSSLFIATSTGGVSGATSTSAAFSISNLGNVTIPNALTAGSLTLTNALSAANGGTGGTSLSAAFGLNGAVFSNTVEHSFETVATTTTWQAGTTTLNYTVLTAGTVINFGCRIFSSKKGNTLAVQFGTGSASTTFAVASSTRGIIAAALAVTANSDLYIDIGATTTASNGVSASTTDKIACGWQERI